MKRRALFFLIVSPLLLFVARATAQIVYKCTEANGTVVFSQYECGKDSTQIDTSSANRHVAAPADAISQISDNASLARLDSDCTSQLDAIDRDFADRISAQQGEVARLRRAMDYSYNNLAGATRDTGIQTQIAGIEGRIAMLESSRDSELAATRNRCSAQRDAEVHRQSDAAAERERIAQEKAAADKAARIAAKKAAQDDK